MINYSIIIPHYNTPELLMRCLATIPVRNDIQVIVIDDCSPNADSYLDKYPELSRPYLEYYSTAQGGSAGRARNIGLDNAKGKWVVCMDADDMFVSNIEEILAESLDRSEDIIYFNYKTVMNDDLSKEGHRKEYQEFFQIVNNKKKNLYFRYYFDPMWGKIISNKLIKEHYIRCDETRYGNDVAFSFKCGAFAKSIAIIDRPFFIITERECSLAAAQFTSMKQSVDEYKIRLGVLLNLIKFIEKEKINIKYRRYPIHAYKFFKDWPSEFIEYYFKYLIPRYTKCAIIIIPYLVYYALIRRI